MNEWLNGESEYISRRSLRFTVIDIQFVRILVMFFWWAMLALFNIVLRVIRCQWREFDSVSSSFLLSSYFLPIKSTNSDSISSIIIIALLNECKLKSSEHNQLTICFNSLNCEHSLLRWTLTHLDPIHWTHHRFLMIILLLCSALVHWGPGV